VKTAQAAVGIVGLAEPVEPEIELVEPVEPEIGLAELEIELVELVEPEVELVELAEPEIELAEPAVLVDNVAPAPVVGVASGLERELAG
jgi:hypothetical protein